MPERSLDVDRDPITINKLLGKRASIGPIPASQVVPWMILGTLSYFIFRMMMGASYTSWGIAWAWLAGSYWALTGDRSYRFFKRWVNPPGENWINGETVFIPVTEPGLWKRKQRETLRMLRVSRKNKTYRFAPFQDFSHLHSIAEIQLGGHTFACLLLYNPKTRQWSAQIPFKFEGLHPQLYRHEVEASIEGLQRCMSELFDNEFLTFHMSCRSDTQQRALELEQLAKQSSLPLISVLLLNEQQRVKELSAQGTRQVWDQTIWASWTMRQSLQGQTDFLGKFVRSVVNSWNSMVRSFVGTDQVYFQDFYAKLARQIYEHGYLAWRNLIETKADLKVHPMTGEELYRWLWYRFNSNPYASMPAIIRVTEGPQGLVQNIPRAGQKDIISRLIQGGQDGKTSCPEHNKQRGYIYLGDRVGKVVVLEDPPAQWRSARDALRWWWGRLSATYVQDTEVVVQITPRERWIVQDELEKMNRQSFTQRRRAFEEGTGKVVHANLQDEHTSDALRKILEGHKPIYCAPILILWRRTERECDEAAVQLCHAFESANAIIEADIAWRVWVETLPINDFVLLTQYAAFSERRITLDSETITGFLPLTCPRPLDQRGVEFLTRQGGRPVYVDMFSQPERLIITGATGSGKSVLGFRFVENALALGIPVVGLDLSTGGNSTFQQAIELLGADVAAYVDILQSRLNLLEPPDIRGLPPKLQIQRFKRWKDFIRQAIVSVAMAQIDKPELLERVDSIVLRLIEVFFSDVEIIERYNDAFEYGWRSPQWQQMPTGHDLLKFCSKEKLGLDSYEAIDAAAINQILNQFGAKLIDPNIGDVIGKPSSVSPSPLITFYALSGLQNDTNSFIMAISAQMACLRNALSHPRSLFVGDEMSVLLSKRGFADLVGEQFATGRKEGLSILLLAQDMDAIVDCSASAKILANLSTLITGLVNHGATLPYIERLGFPPEIIHQNATEDFRGNRAEMCSRWLIARNGRYWDVDFAAPPMMLGALANAEDEKLARQRIFAQYPKDVLGGLNALKRFTEEYVQTLRGSKSLRDIGLSDFERFRQKDRISA